MYIKTSNVRSRIHCLETVQLISSVLATTSAAHFTAFKNLPHVTWVANDYELSDKYVFSTLVRTVGPLSDAGYVVATLFKQFNWDRIGFLYSDECKLNVVFVVFRSASKLSSCEVWSSCKQVYMFGLRPKLICI